MKRLTILSALAILLPSIALLPAGGFAQEGAAQEGAAQIEVPPAPQPQAPEPPADLTPPAGAETTASGLAHQVLEPGDGADRPDANDLVVVHYTGWRSEDGEVFDSSVARGKPALLPLEALIDGWTEGLQLMSEGAKWRLWVPGELAYQGVEGRPQGMLVFDVELIEVRSIPPVPEHLGEPPADAVRSRSGLAWKVLESGEGGESPGPRDTVKVHYIGWNTEGQWFDSTYSRGAPAALPLANVIRGWQEALSTMTPGEKRRVWIPEGLAYAGQEGKPQGALTFDIELLEVIPAG